MKNLSELVSLLEYHVIWPTLFSHYCRHTKPDKKIVLFADAYSNDLTDNMKPIYAALKKSGGYTLVTCFPKESKTPLQSSKHTKISRIVKKISVRFNRSLSHIRFLKLYSTCGTLVLTESYIPAYAVPRRPRTDVVQLWHGCGAFKKWGYSTLDKNFGARKETAELFPMHNCYTLAPVSSAEVSHAYADAYRCSQDIIKPLGVPRTDTYFDTNFVSTAKQKLYNSSVPLQSAYKDASLIENKTIILYAPTFRGNSISDASCQIPIDFEKFIQTLSAATPDFIVLCKLHPFVKNSLHIPKDCEDFVFDISSIPIDIALCASDLLITDYSSVIFEYSLLGRPMIFYAYDIEKYTSERDFYYPYRDFVPGRIVTTQSELETAVLTAKDSFDEERLRKFSEKYMSACDGNSTKRIIDELF